MQNKEPFVKRADEHIYLANDQMQQDEEVTPGAVSASFTYGAARFNAWVAACEFESAEIMAEEKEKIMDYFVKEYKNMLEEHINNHIQTFEFKG